MLADPLAARPCRGLSLMVVAHLLEERKAGKDVEDLGAMLHRFFKWVAKLRTHVCCRSCGVLLPGRRAHVHTRLHTSHAGGTGLCLTVS